LCSRLCSKGVSETNLPDPLRCRPTVPTEQVRVVLAAMRYRLWYPPDPVWMVVYLIRAAIENHANASGPSTVAP